MGCSSSRHENESGRSTTNSAESKDSGIELGLLTIHEEDSVSLSSHHGSCISEKNSNNHKGEQDCKTVVLLKFEAHRTLA